LEAGGEIFFYGSPTILIRRFSGRPGKSWRKKGTCRSKIERLRRRKTGGRCRDATQEGGYRHLLRPYYLVPGLGGKDASPGGSRLAYLGVGGGKSQPVHSSRKREKETRERKGFRSEPFRGSSGDKGRGGWKRRGPPHARGAGTPSILQAQTCAEKGEQGCLGSRNLTRSRGKRWKGERGIFDLQAAVAGRGKERGRSWSEKKQRPSRAAGRGKKKWPEKGGVEGPPNETGCIGNRT